VKNPFKTPLTAAQVKARALELGADLVGIADGAVMDANPPDPADPRRPSDITEHDGARVIVLARRLSDGVARIAGWGDRHKYYNDELALSMLEETALSLVYWLEDNGYPAVIVPPTHVDPWRYQDNPAEHQTPLLSLPHAAVEAGLGTLGLNLQLLTPQYGPRVILSAVLCSVPVECDAPMAEALCQGPSCGRCLAACPGDAVKQWDRDWPACDEFRSPYGFAKLTTHIQAMMDQTDAAARKELLRSETTFNLWQSILRGAGVVTGCRRCADVCPVGEDYAVMLRDAVDAIPEDTPAKRSRLAGLRETDHPDAAGAQSRWVRPLTYLKKARS
jgi:epoxyqueuosine reductase